MKHKFLKLIISVTLLGFLPACKQFKGFKIDATVKNAGNMKVYLEDLSAVQPLIIDTATIRQGHFDMKNYAEKGIYRLRFGDGQQLVIFLCLREHDNIRINADLNDPEHYFLQGSKPSSDIQVIMGQVRGYYKVLDTTFAQLKSANGSAKDSLQGIFLKNKEGLVGLIKDFVEKEEDNDVACFALNLMGPMMQEEIPYLVDVTNRLHEAEPKSRYISMWYQSMQQYRDALLAETQGGVAVGSEAPDIILQSPAGDTVQLSRLRGNYVLLDFWASWCNPCRQENPFVVKAYTKFHAKGFEVFSVSLDANKAQWMKAIAKDGLSWKYHGCDFSGWQSASAQAYHVDAIPSNFLLDKNGKVIAKNLHGDALEQKLDQLYSAAKPQ